MVFGQLAFGGMLALAIPPFFQVQRGFYKSSALVYLSAALVSAVGLGLLALRGEEPGAPGLTLLWSMCALWVLFCGAVVVYVVTLWSDAGLLRARAFASALALGLVAVVANALILKPSSFGIFTGAAFILSALFASAVLGLSSCAMLFGHWYLIDRNMPIYYLRAFVRMLLIALIAEVATLGFVALTMTLFGGATARSALETLAGSDTALLAFRLAIGPAASIVLAWMCWQTLKIPQTMAATGLLYVTVLSVLVGELLGRFILFRTSLPL
jgi:hypothetical protein